MKNKIHRNKTRAGVVFATLFVTLTVLTANAQSTAFTFQGHLTQNGSPANGNFDFIFGLKNRLSGEGTVGSDNTKTNVPVTNGIFTVELDHGVNAFTGANRWMNLQVRPAAGFDSYTNLTPRARITPTPYAISAQSVFGGLNEFPSSGNVGIGTTNPSTLLQVRAQSGGTDDPVSLFSVRNCGAVCAQPAWTEAVRLLNTNDNGRVGIGFVVNSGADLTTVPNAYIGTTDRAVNNDIQIANMNSSGDLQTNVVVKGSGNVGIGTTAPPTKLAVETTGYGITHSAGAVSLATYVNSDSGFLGTRSNHALKFFTNDGGSNLTLNTSGQIDFYAPAAGFRLSHINHGTNGNWYIRSASTSGAVYIQDNGGNVGIGTTTTPEKLTVNGNVKCTTAIITSDRNKKSGFESVDARKVLEKVAAMPITKWHYKTDTGTPHIGPVAQDFHEAFGLGQDDKHIATVDADGIALAAIQGLSQIVAEKDAKIDELEKRLDALEKALGR